MYSPRRMGFVLMLIIYRRTQNACKHIIISRHRSVSAHNGLCMHMIRSGHKRYLLMQTPELSS